MKTFRFLWTCLLMVTLPFGFTACSDDDEEPVVEPEEDIIMETPLPADAEPYKVYAFRHEKNSYIADAISSSILGTIH